MSRNFISFQQRNKAAVQRGAGKKSALADNRRRPSVGAAPLYQTEELPISLGSVSSQHRDYHVPSDLHLNQPTTRTPTIGRRTQKSNLNDLNILGAGVQTPGQEIFGERVPSGATDLLDVSKGAQPARHAWTLGSSQNKLLRGQSAGRLRTGATSKHAGAPRVQGSGFSSPLQVNDWMEQFAGNATFVLKKHHSTINSDDNVLRRMRVSGKPEPEDLEVSDVIGDATGEERSLGNGGAGGAFDRTGGAATASSHSGARHAHSSALGQRRQDDASSASSSTPGARGRLSLERLGSDQRLLTDSEGHWNAQWDPSAVRSSFVRQGGATNGSAVRPRTAEEAWPGQSRASRAKRSGGSGSFDARLRRPGVDHNGQPPDKEKVVVPSQGRVAEEMERQEQARLRNREWAGQAKVLYDSKLKRSQDEVGLAAGVLTFDAHFESGNLRRAIQVGASEYDLALCSDTNTVRHMQWYYFKISNVRRGVQYKLNIVNMCKSRSLYNVGLRPLTYSKKRFSSQGVGWARGCVDIAYFKSSIYYRRQSRLPFRTLTFTYEGEYDDDTVFFAHCYPYTIKHLERDLSKIQADPARKALLHRKVLCKTPGGNECLELTITSLSAPSNEVSRRRGIFIIARCHPGETPSSYILRGIIDFLTRADDAEARSLRDTFVFKIVPMMNPDGVVSGNTRTTLHGSDLNRCWQEPTPTQSPLDAIKELVGRFAQERTLALSIDLHAHSRRCNLFSFGCSTHRPGGFRDHRPPGFERVFPRMLADRCEAFQYSGCSYNMGKSKQGTGRLVVHRECRVLTSYTIEASFLGGDTGEYEGLHYTSADYERMGLEMCQAMLDFGDEERVAACLEGLPEIAMTAEEESDEEESSASDFDSEGDSGDDPLPLSPRALEDERDAAREAREAARPRTSQPQLPSAAETLKAAASPALDSAARRARTPKKKMPAPKLPARSTRNAAALPSDAEERPPLPRRKKGVRKESPGPSGEPLAPPAPSWPLPSPIAVLGEAEPPGLPPRAPSSPAHSAGEALGVEALVERAQSSPESPPAKAMDPLALRPEEFAVLDRVKDIKKQMAGTSREFSMLQERIQRYDGYASKVFAAD